MKKVRILELENGRKRVLPKSDFRVEQRDGETLVLR